MDTSSKAGVIGQDGSAPLSSGFSRRRFSAMMYSAAGLAIGHATGLTRVLAAGSEQAPLIAPALSYPLYEEAVAHVLPPNGFQSRIGLGDSIGRLVEYGVIDPEKFLALYGGGENLPAELADVIGKSWDGQILLTVVNANYYVNLLWPVGLATQMAGNAESPLNGDSLYNFASTGGWTLGREDNGGAYFDRFNIVELTPDQEARVIQIAKSTYRPCCNNSTFFQDCNHGSALLGVLQLGASQGLSDDELYREALVFNSFWFPAYYVRTALFFKVAMGTEWPDVDPRVALGFDYSAGGPWMQNVAAYLDTQPDLIPPEPGGGAGCGV